MKKITLFVIIATLFTGTLPAAGFSLSWQRDVPIAAAGAAVFALSQVLLHNDPEPDYKPLSEDIFAPDRALMRAYNDHFDTASDITEMACLSLPVLFAADFDPDRALTAAVMYAEAGLLATGLKDLGKALTSRYRPYTYFDGAPTDEGSDDWHSFPSGHTTISFTGASFTATLFHAWYADSSWKWPVTAGAASLAAASGILRIAAGKHFLTDVLAGAALGAACGILAPLLHLDGDGGTAEGDTNRSLPPVTLAVHLRK